MRVLILALGLCGALTLTANAADDEKKAEPRKRPPLTEEQKTLMKEIREKYDKDKDGRLDLVEQKALKPEDKQRLSQAGMGGRWWASLLYTVVPNWQLFWLADALEGKNQIPWSYVGRAFGYVIGYLGASLALGLVLFEERELS